MLSCTDRQAESWAVRSLDKAHRRWCLLGADQLNVLSTGNPHATISIQHQGCYSLQNSPKKVQAWCSIYWHETHSKDPTRLQKILHVDCFRSSRFGSREPQGIVWNANNATLITWWFCSPLSITRRSSSVSKGCWGAWWLPASAVGILLPAPAVGDQAIRRSSYKRARGVKRQLSWWELRRHEDERDLS